MKKADTKEPLDLIWGKARERYLNTKNKIEKGLARELRKIASEHKRSQAETKARGEGILF